MQSRIMSLIETIANVASGMVVSFVVGLWLYPLYGFQASASQTASLTLVFTGVSILRAYAWRRVFNRVQMAMP